MSDFIFITGKLGQGKTLVAVGKSYDYLYEGRRVVSNVDLDLKAMFGVMAKKCKYTRLPDKPNRFDLDVIGRGYEGDYDENKTGLLLLDECGDWFNAHDWNDKGRKEVNSWFRHARKLGWDVHLLVQNFEIIDAQARKALMAQLATVKRMDKLAIPYFTAFSKLWSTKGVRFPKSHLANVRDADGLKIDSWFYFGRKIYKYYDTNQLFLDDYEHGTHTPLSPWYTHGRYRKPLTWNRLMRITKIYWKSLSRPIAFAAGFLLPVASYGVINFGDEATALIPVKAPDPTPLYKDYKISSYQSYPGYTVYIFTDKDGKKVDSSDLELKGIKTTPLGPQKAKLLFKGGYEITLYR